MKDEEKSGLPILTGDLVSLLPLCCAFGAPEFVFLLFVGSPVLNFLIANLLPVLVVQPLTPHSHSIIPPLQVSSFPQY